MIKSFRLKFGRAAGIPPEAMQTTPVTVFVGPNNSGKSVVLREIARYCVGGQRSAGDVIVDQIEFTSSSQQVAEGRMASVTLVPERGETLAPENVIFGMRVHRGHVNRASLLRALQEPNADPGTFCRCYLGYHLLTLDGTSRIGLVNDQQAGDLQGQAKTSLQVLFKNNEKRAEVRRIVHDAFNLFFVIDPTRLGNLRIRLASRAPNSEAEERGIHDDAVKYHSVALPIDQASDGVKAFTGMITEIIAGDPSVLLIDEPEAFLHPALSFKLGKEIALVSSRSEKRLFVSTHSTNFVMGCIQSGLPVNIVRLTYRNNVATSRVLPSADILRLMRNPLLRSTGVLSGLFYEFVIVTESDADRAFYQEINERLLRYKPEGGIPNCLFLNAQNKQTVRTIIRPLREMGIPTAGIVDIDVLKEGGSVWTEFLSSGFVPNLEQQSLGTVRAALKEKFDAAGQEMKRGGITLLDEADREAANNLFDRLSQYGLFVVRRGQQESWLPELHGAGHGPNWLIDIFEKMGEDPDSPNYIRPATSDVWEFLGGIRSWLMDANMHGIPS